MTIALAALAISTVLSPALCLYTLTRYLNQRDERESKDRQVWANRVQSPETAVVQSLTPVEVTELGPPDTEWSEIAAHARMEDAFTEGA